MMDDSGWRFKTLAIVPKFYLFLSGLSSAYIISDVIRMKPVERKIYHNLGEARALRTLSADYSLISSIIQSSNPLPLLDALIFGALISSIDRNIFANTRCTKGSKHKNLLIQYGPLQRSIFVPRLCWTKYPLTLLNSFNATMSAALQSCLICSNWQSWCGIVQCQSTIQLN